MDIPCTRGISQIVLQPHLIHWHVGIASFNPPRMKTDGKQNRKRKNRRGKTSTLAMNWSLVFVINSFAQGFLALSA